MSTKFGSESIDQGAQGRRDDLFGQSLMLYRISRSTAWTAFFAIVIATGLAAGGYFFWRQLTVLEDQLSELGDLSEKVKQSFDAGAVQSAALTTALQSMTEQMVRVETTKEARAVGPDHDGGVDVATVRPWVGIDTVVADALQANRKFISNVNVRNTGRSPATNVRATWTMAAIPTGNVASPEPEPCSKCTEAVLMPNAATTYNVVMDEAALANQNFTRIRNGDDAIVLHGRIDYADSSGGTHVTRVCMIYAPGASRFSACAQGNRFD